MASLTLDWIHLASVVGALQGVLLAGALVAQRRNRTANRLLAALMASFAVYLAAGVYYDTGMVRRFPYFFSVGYYMPWLFGPLVYLYAVAASDRSWRLTSRTIVHALPVVVIVAMTAPLLLLDAEGKRALIERLVAGDMPARLRLLDPTKYVSGIGYSAATVWLLRRHRRAVEFSYSNTSRINLAWLLWLGGAAAAIWFVATVLAFTPAESGLSEAPISLSIAVLVYAIGYMGLKQPEVFRYETSEFPVATSPVAAATETLAPTPRYERSGLDAAEAFGLESALRAVMDRETPWRDSELTLADLAGRLRTSPHKLSEVLNSRIGQTFYDFVNGYRVREVQRRIAAGEAQRRKMLALALDAGFASKSTFNQAFKKHTSRTPSDFLRAESI